MSAHDEQQAKTLAETIADELFINGFGEKAVRLKMLDATGRDLGGWCRAAVVQRIAAALRASTETGTCEWAQDGDDGGWDGSCGASWVFESHGPAENHVTYCPSCGKPLAVR